MVEVNLTEKRYNLINTYLNELAKYIESQDYAKCLLISVINYSDEYEEDLFDEDLLRDTSILLTIACDDRENVSYKALEEECNNELAYKINRILGIEISIGTIEYSSINDISIRNNPTMGNSLLNAEIIFDKIGTISYIKDLFDKEYADCYDTNPDCELVEFNPPLVLK